MPQGKWMTKAKNTTYAVGFSGSISASLASATLFAVSTSWPQPEEVSVHAHAMHPCTVRSHVDRKCVWEHSCSYQMFSFANIADLKLTFCPTRGAYFRAYWAAHVLCADTSTDAASTLPPPSARCGPVAWPWPPQRAGAAASAAIALRPPGTGSSVARALVCHCGDLCS